MNLYRLKRTVLAPYIWHMRHKERHQTGFIKGALELQYYRPLYYRFIGANMIDPEMLYTAPLGPDSVVIDVSAHVGDWAAHMFEKYRSRIVAFEPDPESFPALAERFRGNDKVSVFDYGLHDRDAVLDMAQMGMGSTMFDEPMPSETPANHVSVRVRDVATVLDELRVGWIDLLKVNIEGGEFELLDRLIDSAWMSRVRCLMVQFHEWRSGAHLWRLKIRHALRRTHTEDWNYAFVWEKWNLK
jgi:FkbM family methyltransferase